VFFFLFTHLKKTMSALAANLPSFVHAGFAYGFLAVVIAFDTTNRTGVNVGFEGAPNCNFTAAGSGLFALNQTWYECFPTPINAAGTTTNAIDVASIWHTDLGALPTLYTLLLTLQFQTLVEVTSSLTVLNTDTATVTVYQPAAAHPTPPVTTTGSSGGGAAIGAGVGAIVGGLFVLLGAAACWRTTRRQQTVAPAV
jgi:hypothetical protein